MTLQAGPLGPTIAPLGPPGGPQLPGLLGALGMGMGLGGMGGAAGPPDGSPPQQPAGAGYGGGAVGGAGRTDSSGSGSPPQAVTSPLSLTPPGLPSPDGPMFNCPRRPNLGREGRAIVLRANHFQVTNQCEALETARCFVRSRCRGVSSTTTTSPSCRTSVHAGSTGRSSRPWSTHTLGTATSC